jgi:hypothetical protein
MKRHGNLFEKIVDLDNILLAHENAKKNKSHYPEVKRINVDPKKYAFEIQHLLKSKTFTTSDYAVFWKNCGTKSRWIYKLPYYPDRIVQHAVMQIIEPILVPCLIRDTFQSLKGRGNHDARKRIEKAIRTHNPKYALKFDIKQFYPSVDNQKLKNALRKKIKCSDTLWLLDNIIDSTQGLPVGNYSSQILGNFYLNGLDHYAKEQLKIKYYYRYCDDILILCDDATTAHRYRKTLFNHIKQNLNLVIKDDWRVYPVADGVDYVGWIFYPDRTLLRKRITRNFVRKIRFIHRNHHTIEEKHITSAIASYWGMFKYTNAKRLWKKHITPEFTKKLDKYYQKPNPLTKMAR